MNILQAKGIQKTYAGKVAYQALNDVDLTIGKGEFVGIMGPSGSGKTTLLNVVSTIDRPTSGSVLINGSNPYELSQEKLARFRRRELGFVFQSFNLLDTMTVRENIMLPLTLEGAGVEDMKSRAGEMAEKLGIAGIMDKRTYEISGGQAQRTAIARALIHKPNLLLADEPTGNLDSGAARDVMSLMEGLNKNEGATMMLVTHDAMAASYCDRVVFIKDGRTYSEVRRGDSRSEFYNQIMQVLSLLGGSGHELSTIRV
ncbi:ABC transporter ATP-binding protein [Paenibacillus sp. J5C_2022]|uniref:ABC transporter ATP-binding protein n=1 Tax=Paenibacillus sp. J5C2022 TaxID=2977129 RepID=UPI0021D223CB|nr:ABC transporter ATP-binding protein [Paenibacillus sp. J5C2022]MCU6710969.1 ABC transporter ATP-binding protein [Paenibacillus sp. J5C2022]